MKITNKYGLPKPLVSLVAKDTYSKGASQYSVTELMSPPRVRRLREQYDDVIETDVTDLGWQFIGKGIHINMENASNVNHINEERLFVNVDGVTISGAIDLQEETPEGVIITDYKFTSAWAFMQEKVEWHQQLNIYKWLVETVKRKKVTKLQICAFIRDFNRRQIKEGYPRASIDMVDVPLWDAVTTETYIRERLEMHRNAKVSHDFGEELPFCSDEERWKSTPVFAVKREGRKTAIRLFETREEADELAVKEKGYVEERPAEPKRCTGNYCSVAQWCEQYQGEINERN